MSHRVRKHRLINRVVRQHLNELNNVKQVDDAAETSLIVNVCNQNCVPVSFQYMDVQNDLVHTEFESVLEEVHAIRNRAKVHQDCFRDHLT